MVSKANSIDAIPLFGRIFIIKFLFGFNTAENHVNSGICIVNQNIQSTIVIILDSFEKSFYFRVIGMINNDSNAFTPSLVDFVST